MTQYVVDACVVIKWFIDEVHAEAARRLQAEHYDLLAPDLLWPESGNILWKKVRCGELTQLKRALSLAQMMPFNSYVAACAEISVTEGTK
jgi:predicted nucleic acid-binding protein